MEAAGRDNADFSAAAIAVKQANLREDNFAIVPQCSDFDADERHSMHLTEEAHSRWATSGQAKR